MKLICPVCGTPLFEEGHAAKCENGHSYDIAKQGYVNLLTVQQKHSLNPGDTQEQVAARRCFLEGGYYAPLQSAICRMAADYGCRGPILDAGCGEGYYGSALQKAMDAELLGVDVSKIAVRYAAGKYKDAQWVCGTAAHLPVEDHVIGLLTSLFAVTLPEEFSRVLKRGGHFLQVLAGADHLTELKRIIYPNLLHREKDSVPQLPGFRLLESRRVDFTFTAEGAQVQNLLYMTPHVYRITKEGAAALAATDTLTDTAHCVINLYESLYI